MEMFIFALVIGVVVVAVYCKKLYPFLKKRGAVNLRIASCYLTAIVPFLFMSKCNSFSYSFDKVIELTGSSVLQSVIISLLVTDCLIDCINPDSRKWQGIGVYFCIAILCFVVMGVTCFYGYDSSGALLLTCMLTVLLRSLVEVLKHYDP